VAAVIGGSPGAEEFAGSITRFKGSPYVKGVRESLRRGSSTDPQFLKGIRLLGQLGMSFDLRTGPEGLAEAAAVAEACPDTRFILDHCGNADARDFRASADADARSRRKRWEDGVAKFANRPNVICKISGVLEAAAPDRLSADDVAPVINHCLDCFGPDRVVYASNWPVCNRGGSFRQWVGVLRDVVGGRSNADQRKLFHDNAMRFYGLR
jgi:L-fuconolactonase